MHALLEFYRRESTISAIPTIMMGIISGLAQGILLGIITIAADTASYETLNFQFFVMFVLAFAIMILGRRYTFKQSSVIVENLIRDVRVRLSDKIRSTDLLFLENVGTGELYSRLANDTNLISQSAIMIINACQSAVIVFFSLLFVAWLSKAALLITLLAFFLGAINYISHIGKVHQELQDSLHKESRFLELINEILQGFKELKMNRKKSDEYFWFFTQLATDTRDLKISISLRFVTMMMYSQVFSYFLIGAIVFILPRFEQIDPALIIRITSALLFIMGPMSAVVSSLSAFSQAEAAIEHLYTLEAQLDASNGSAQESTTPFESFETITLDQVEFSYLDPSGAPLFTVGPLNLEIRQGEVLFLVGGNGSGKTTLLKVLAGLYTPMAGTMTLDRTAITKERLQQYRELFSIIFGDFYLFKRLYGLGDLDIERVSHLLEFMEIEHKTSLIDKEFTNIALSTGQRKRLALIVALLEDRPIYVFDEWAADQDPHFRKYFYEVLLQKMKDEGKTIIAVSHDDRYFHVADRVVKMEYGQFVPFYATQPGS